VPVPSMSWLPASAKSRIKVLLLDLLQISTTYFAGGFAEGRAEHLWSMIVSVPTSNRPMSAGLMPRFSMRRETAVSIIELMSS
jgi:hypothetical protein